MILCPEHAEHAVAQLDPAPCRNTCEVSWKDGDGVDARAVYAALRATVRLRGIVRDVRGMSALTGASLVLVILAITLRSWVLVAGFFVVLLLNLAQWLYFHHYISRSGISEVDEMTGWEFERWLHHLFEELEFTVERTPYRGDFGADFILTWRGVRIAVQAKRAARPVGVRAVQEVVAAKRIYGCERAMVVTSGYFTEQAIVLGRANDVWMRTRDDLARAIVSVQGARESARTAIPQAS